MPPSAHRGPGAVRIAASVAASDLRLAVDIDGVRIGPALQSVGLIGGTRNHRSITTGIRILPRHRRTRLSAFERLHLRRIGAPLVVVVHAGADAIADQTAKRRASEASRDALAGSAAELRSDQTAGQPHQRACPYSLSVLGRSQEYRCKPPSAARRARQRSGERKTCLKPPDDLTP